MNSKRFAKPALGFCSHRKLKEPDVLNLQIKRNSAASLGKAEWVPSSCVPVLEIYGHSSADYHKNVLPHNLLWWYSDVKIPPKKTVRKNILVVIGCHSYVMSTSATHLPRPFEKKRALKFALNRVKSFIIFTCFKCRENVKRDV